MGNTIILDTRVLLATRVFYGEILIQGGSNKAESARRDKSKRNMVGLLSCSRQGQMNIYSRLEKLKPNTHEVMIHPWNFGT
jgi:hypothetical protein